MVVVTIADALGTRCRLVLPCLKRAPTALVLGLCLVVAACANVLVPTVQGRELQLCLVLMHGGVLLALMPVMPRVASTTLLDLLYLALGLTASLSWWQVNAALWLQQATSAMDLWTVMWDHPAQSSISPDVIVTLTICAYWVNRQEGRKVTLLFLLGVGLLSLRGAFCLYQLWRLKRQT